MFRPKWILLFERKSRRESGELFSFLALIVISSAKKLPMIDFLYSNAHF